MRVRVAVTPVDRGRTTRAEGIPIAMKSSCILEFLMATDSISLAAKRECSYSSYSGRPAYCYNDLIEATNYTTIICTHIFSIKHTVLLLECMWVVI